MKTLEARLSELVADNRAASDKALAEYKAASDKALADNRVAFERLQGAFEKLRTGIVKAVFGGIVASVTILGGIIAILAFVLQPGG